MCVPKELLTSTVVQQWENFIVAHTTQNQNSPAKNIDDHWAAIKCL